MHLSSIYIKKQFWALVYHTQPDSLEVELITNRLFPSRKKALKWFNRKRVPSAYIQPEAVPVAGVGALIFHHEEACRITDSDL